MNRYLQIFLGTMWIIFLISILACAFLFLVTFPFRFSDSDEIICNIVFCRFNYTSTLNHYPSVRDNYCSRIYDPTCDEDKFVVPKNFKEMIGA